MTRGFETGVFEKGRVNTSVVHGTFPEKLAGVLRVPATISFATGVSLVL